jgi:hypothetical protein
LLDEVKRLENEVREIKMPQIMDLATNPDNPFFLNANSMCHHNEVSMFGFEQRGLLGKLGQGGLNPVQQPHSGYPFAPFETQKISYNNQERSRGNPGAHQSAFIYGETDQYQNCYDNENLYGVFDQQSQQSNSQRGGGSRILSKHHSQSRFYPSQNLTQ